MPEMVEVPGSNPVRGLGIPLVSLFGSAEKPYILADCRIAQPVNRSMAVISMSTSETMAPVLADRPVRQLRHPITRRPKLDLAAAQQRAEELAQEVIGLQNVTAVCRHKKGFGAFFEVSDGVALGLSGLLHVRAFPGGDRALEALNVGDILTLDISGAVVQTKGNKPEVRLAFDGFGNERRAAAIRQAVFARGGVPRDGGFHWGTARRGKERF